MQTVELERKLRSVSIVVLVLDFRTKQEAKRGRHGVNVIADIPAEYCKRRATRRVCTPPLDVVAAPVSRVAPCSLQQASSTLSLQVGARAQAGSKQFIVTCSASSCKRL